MKTVANLLLLAFILTGVGNLLAAKAGERRKPNSPQSPQPKNPALQTEATQLTLVWQRLDAGLHDYRGHRAKAQQQIQLAGKELGLQLAVNPRPQLSQVNSDSLLREARALLLQVQTSLSNQNKPKALQHIAKAIAEIDLALRVR